MYLIDFLNAAGGVRFRVYYQDVPSDGAFGRIPEDVLAEHEVNLALLCAGNWKTVEHHDADCIICNLRPEHVLIGHWEDFFKQQDDPSRIDPAPLQDVGQFKALLRRRMKEVGRNPENVILPAPGLFGTYPVTPESGDRQGTTSP